MKKFVPLEKRSKKERKAYYAKQRGSWNGVNPVTKVVPNKKIYDRKQAKRWKDDPSVPPVFCHPPSSARASDSVQGRSMPSAQSTSARRWIYS